MVSRELVATLSAVVVLKAIKKEPQNGEKSGFRSLRATGRTLGAPLIGCKKDSNKKPKT
jgi:hypothetical protein